PTVILALSLHDALPIYFIGRAKRAWLVAAVVPAHRVHCLCIHPILLSAASRAGDGAGLLRPAVGDPPRLAGERAFDGFRLPHDEDRKSTRLNSSHVKIS